MYCLSHNYQLLNKHARFVVTLSPSVLDRAAITVNPHSLCPVYKTFNYQTAVMFSGWLYLGTLLSQQYHIACHGARDISEVIARRIAAGGIASASITSRI